jgi:hypothetical protein
MQEQQVPNYATKVTGWISSVTTKKTGQRGLWLTERWPVGFPPRDLPFPLRSKFLLLLNQSPDAAFPEFKRTWSFAVTPLDSTALAID